MRHWMLRRAPRWPGCRRTLVAAGPDLGFEPNTDPLTNPSQLVAGGISWHASSAAQRMRRTHLNVGAASNLAGAHARRCAPWLPRSTREACKFSEGWHTLRRPIHADAQTAHAMPPQQMNASLAMPQAHADSCRVSPGLLKGAWFLHTLKPSSSAGLAMFKG